MIWQLCDTADNYPGEKMKTQTESVEGVEKKKGLTKLQITFCMSSPYPIFVIFFTQAKILDRKFYTEERVNYGKRILRQNSVNCDLLAQANYTNYTLSVKLHTVCKTTHCV